MKRIPKLAALLAIAGLTACGGGSVTNGTSVLPTTTQVSLATLGKLTFAVGTATLPDGTTGLNVVAYLRQANGLTAYLVDSPSITGPSGFKVPVVAGNADSGTASITSTPQTGGTTTSTFGTSGGLFGGGFGPFNAGVGGGASYPTDASPSSAGFQMPIFAPSGLVSLLLGPPAAPATTGDDYPTAFAGYLPGFLSFEAAPVAGSYSLSVGVAAANASGTTISGTASLASAAPALAAVAAPVATKDGAGGFTSITFTAPAGTVESLVFVDDTANNTYYTVEVAGAGAQSVALGDGLGRCGGPSGCGNKSFNTGDGYSITVASFDYSDFEATQPGNTSQSPALGLPASGQADVSMSPATTGTY